METADGRLRYEVRWITLFFWTVVCLFFACGCSGSGTQEREITSEDAVTLAGSDAAERMITRRLTVLPASCNAGLERKRKTADSPALLQAAGTIPVQEQIDCIRFQPVFEIDIQETDMTGALEYRNRGASTLDVVILLCVSDAELIRAGYDLTACGVRTEEEMKSPDYCETEAYTVLFRSAVIRIGECLERCALTTLPNGVPLAEGDYHMVLRVDAYQPLTGGKSAVSAANETVVRIHA